MYTRELKTNNKNKASNKNNKQGNNEKHNMAIEIVIDYKKKKKQSWRWWHRGHLKKKEVISFLL